MPAREPRCIVPSSHGWLGNGRTTLRGMDAAHALPTPATRLTTTPTGLQWGPVLLHNIRRALPGPHGGLIGGRLPTAALAGLEDKGRTTEPRGTGCELRFRLRGEAATVRVRTVPMADRVDNGLVEVWHGAFPAHVTASPVAVSAAGWSTVRIARVDSERLRAVGGGTPWDPELVRFRLPYDRVWELGGVEGDIAPPEPGDMPTRRLCAYGSSITHGSNALLPSATGMWHAADLLGMDLLNLGFPGSAWLEPVVAAHIAADPSWTVATAELGINVIGRWTPDEFAARVDAFLAILARAGRPVLVTGLYRCRAMVDQAERFTAYQRIVAEAAARHRLHHIDGMSFLSDWRELSSDLVHPTPDGMRAIGRRWAQAIHGVPGET